MRSSLLKAEDFPRFSKTTPNDQFSCCGSRLLSRQCGFCGIHNQPAGAGFHCFPRVADDGYIRRQLGTTLVSVNGTNGFAGAVALSCSGLPVGTTCAFAPASVTGTSISTLAITTSANAGMNTSPVDSPLVPLAALAAAFGCICTRRRRIGLLVLLAWGALTGCGGGGSPSKSGQTSTASTVTVTGTSGTLSHSISLTLTLTH